jgi:uncharacterized protein (DUF2164 family)
MRVDQAHLARSTTRALHGLRSHNDLHRARRYLRREHRRQVQDLAEELAAELAEELA